jgi:DNA polymerase-3 subunit epsilon
VSRVRRLLRRHRREAVPETGGPARLLAIDLETTGLDPARDSVLAIGFVPVEDGEIVLAGARRIVVAGAHEVGDSATIHGLTDDDVAAGVPLTEALDETLAALDGRALLAHHAPIETIFLARSCRETGRTWPEPAVVDTMAAEARHHERWGHQAPPGALRLWAARDRFGLPAYKAHDALMDAIGCAELHLAQVAERERR